MAAPVGWALISARLRWQEPVTTAIAALVLLAAVGPPLVAAAGEMLASNAAFALLASDRLWLLLLRSVGLATLVTALALGAGVPLGVFFARAALPWKRWLFAAHLAVVFLPPFLPTLGWFHIFGREGFIGGPASADLLFSDFGAVLVLAACFVPAVTALVSIGVLGVDITLEEAARSAGGPWRAAAFVLVPCAAPVIALAGIVVFALAFSELGVPMFLRIDVYPAVVFARLGGMDFAPGEAAVFAMPLVLVASALVWLDHRLAGRRAIAALASTIREREALFAFRPWILGVCMLAAAVSLAPIVALLAHAIARGGFSDVWSWIGYAPLNGVLASALAALAMTALAVILGRSLARERLVGRWFDGAAMLAFILPSAILGVGIVLAWNRPSTNWLYASLGVLVIGFVARYSALATRTFAAAVAQHPASIEEAARSVGAGYIQRLGLLVGLLRPALFATFALAFVFSLRDLETAALFYPPGGEPLTVRIFTLEANGPPGVVSALALLHVLITYAAIGLAWIGLKGRRAA